MKTSNLSFDEIQAAEQASEDRRKSRNQGFSKMYERDAAYRQLSNGATMYWHINKEQRERKGYFIDDNGVETELTTYDGYNIPEDSFMLKMPGGKEYMFNLDEFRRSLRWG